MSRGHVQGYDSNAAQFARMGDPWITERDRQETGKFPNSRKVQRQNRQVRPCDRHYPEPREVRRPPTPEEERAERQRAMLTHVTRLSRQARGQDVREVAGYKPREAPVCVIKPAREKPISEWAPEKIAGDIARLEREHRRALSEARGIEPVRMLAERELGPIAL